MVTISDQLTEFLRRERREGCGRGETGMSEISQGAFGKASMKVRAKGTGAMMLLTTEPRSTTCISRKSSVRRYI